MDEYLSVDEAAAELGVSAHVIRKRLQRGLMTGERVGRRVWVLPRDEVDRWRGVGKLPKGRKPAHGTESERVGEQHEQEGHAE